MTANASAAHAEACRLERRLSRLSRKVEAVEAECIAKGGTPHDHTEYVPGCFRCDLARTEVQ